MEAVALAFLVAAFVVGFLIAGKWCSNILLQLIVGAAMGIAIIGVLAFTALGVTFAGCLLVGATANFH